ncbi:MAG: isoprenylcysteine carboxylmethyltransferase family protein [Acidobacteriota bacterium]
MTGVVLALAGTLRDPWLWAYTVLWSSTTFYAMFSLDEDLARERYSPPTAGADGVALHFVRGAALAHLVVGVLDGSRWHLTAPVPATLRALALGGMTACLTMFFRAMHENHFFSSVVRLQTERGHRVVDSGPYAVVRHPGYAGALLAGPCSGLALGSWIAGGIGVLLTAFILRRVIFEDAFLRKNLAGYEEYTHRVRSRVIPGVW